MVKNRFFLFSFVAISSCSAHQQEHTPLHPNPIAIQAQRQQIQPNLAAIRASNQQGSTDLLMQNYQSSISELINELNLIRNTPDMASEEKNTALTRLINRASCARSMIAPRSVHAARRLSILIDQARSLQG